jgi:hypothetical protein
MSDESQKNGLPDSFAVALSGLRPEREVYFLSVLSHNVTVAVRGVYADKLDAEQSLRKLYGLNEIQHQISSRLIHLSAGDEMWAADSFVKALMSRASTYDCEDEILVAFKFTLPFA